MKRWDPRDEQETIDFIQEDIMGKGELDDVYLMGERHYEDPYGLITHIALKVEPNGDPDQAITVPLPNGNGYSPMMFIGDFTGDGVKDILITFFSTPSGGYTYNYIYTLADGKPTLIFDARLYNEAYDTTAKYQDGYKVTVESPNVGKRFVIDISNKDDAYLQGVYDIEQHLLKEKEANVSGVIAANPSDPNFDEVYNLSIIQKITGLDQEDVLALLETFLRWDPIQEKFEPFMQYVSLMGAGF